MVDLAKPKFGPDQWVVFKLGGGQYFGKILGGDLQDEWHYTITIGRDNSMMVAESDVLAVYNGKNWHKPVTAEQRISLV
jgi:hypothetical protein